MQQWLSARWRPVRRFVLLRRRPLAAVCAVVAVLAGVRAAGEPAVPTAPVVVARADLPGGRPLARDDLVVVPLPAEAVPDGTAGAPDGLVGRVLAAPVRRGEPVTDARLVAPGLLTGYPGRVAAPVRVADEAAVRLLRVGDLVDVVATPADGSGAATTAVRAAPVVALPRARPTELGAGGGLVVLAVTESDALRLAGAAVTAVLGVVLRP